MSFRHYIRFARSVLLRDRPIYVHVAVSDRCDLRCRACAIWRRDKPMEEMATAHYRRLAEILFHLGCIQVSLGGGEPVLRPDLPEVVAAFVERGIRTRVLTNGVAMTPERADSLLRAGLREISFSLDSLNPARQESLDGAKGSFRTRIDNLISLAEKLAALRSMPVLNTMVTPENIDELPVLLELARKIGFAISFIPIHLGRKETEHRFYSADSRLGFSAGDEPRIREIYKNLIQAKRKGDPIVNSTAFLKSSPDYLLTGRADWPCLAGRSYLSVSPDGKISPCHLFEADESWAIPFEEFPAVFHSSSYRYGLARLIHSCEGCFRPCWAEISYMTTDFSAMLDMARLQLSGKGNTGPLEGQMIRKWIASRAEALE